MGDRGAKSPSSAHTVRDDSGLLLSDRKRTMFEKAFKFASKTEDLLVAKSCKYESTSGHVFCTKTTLHFYGKLFTKKIKLSINYADIRNIEKKKTGLLPNAIRVSTDHFKLTLKDFAHRDAVYDALYNAWRQVDPSREPQETLSTEDDTIRDESSEESGFLVVPSIRLVEEEDGNDDEYEYGLTDDEESGHRTIPLSGGGDGSGVVEDLELQDRTDLRRSRSHSDARRESSGRLRARGSVQEPTRTQTDGDVTDSPQKPPKSPRPAPLSIPTSTTTPDTNARSGSVTPQKGGAAALNAPVGTSPPNTVLSSTPPDDPSAAAGLARRRTIGFKEQGQQAGAASATTAPLPQASGSSDTLVSASKGGVPASSSAPVLSTVTPQSPDVSTPISEVSVTHEGTVVTKALINAPLATFVSAMWEDDAELFKKFHNRRKNIDLVVPSWAPAFAPEGSREVTYTMPCKIPMYSKSFTPVLDTQRIVRQEPLIFVIQTETRNPDVPFGDYFSVFCNYYMTAVSHTTSRLVISTTVKFVKSTMLKGKIERAAVDGMKPVFSDMLSEINGAYGVPTSAPGTAGAGDGSADLAGVDQAGDGKSGDSKVPDFFTALFHRGNLVKSSSIVLVCLLLGALIATLAGFGGTAPPTEYALLREYQAARSSGDLALSTLHAGYLQHSRAVADVNFELNTLHAEIAQLDSRLGVTREQAVFVESE